MSLIDANHSSSIFSFSSCCRSAFSSLVGHHRSEMTDVFLWCLLFPSSRLTYIWRLSLYVVVFLFVLVIHPLSLLIDFLLSPSWFPLLFSVSLFRIDFVLIYFFEINHFPFTRQHPHLILTHAKQGRPFDVSSLDIVQVQGEPRVLVDSEETMHSHS